MTPAEFRSATWRSLHPGTNEHGYQIWTAKEVPGVARIARNGAIWWRCQVADYRTVEDVVEAYNVMLDDRLAREATATFAPAAIPIEAVRVAVAASLGVDPRHVPDDIELFIGMRRALVAFGRFLQQETS